MQVAQSHCHSEKIHCPAGIWSLHDLLVLAGISPGYSGFLPQKKNTRLGYLETPQLCRRLYFVTASEL